MMHGQKNVKLYVTSLNL